MTIQDAPSFNGKIWKRISNDARHFIESKFEIFYFIDLLPKDPKKRLGIKQAIDHPWINIKKNTKNSTSKFREYTTLEDK